MFHEYIDKDNIVFCTVDVSFKLTALICLRPYPGSLLTQEKVYLIQQKAPPFHDPPLQN